MAKEKSRYDVIREENDRPQARVFAEVREALGALQQRLLAEGHTVSKLGEHHSFLVQWGDGFEEIDGVRMRVSGELDHGGSGYMPSIPGTWRLRWRGPSRQQSRPAPEWRVKVKVPNTAHWEWGTRKPAQYAKLMDEFLRRMTKAILDDLEAVKVVEAEAATRRNKDARIAAEEKALRKHFGLKDAIVHNGNGILIVTTALSFEEAHEVLEAIRERAPVVFKRMLDLDRTPQCFRADDEL